jgi:hypothetical protein
LVQHPGRAHHRKRAAAHGAGDRGRDLASLHGHPPSSGDAALLNQPAMPLQDSGARKLNNWVSEEANNTFINDEEMQKRLLETNPNSFRKLVSTFLEANGRGYWETSEENLEKLKQLYQDEVEDKIEGIDRPVQEICEYHLS